MNLLQEPTPIAFAHPVKRYVGATRPAFLSITLAGCLLGWATAPTFNLGLAAATLLLALLAHAGVNVFNDYYDHLNGTDAANTQRVFPFTGGSRFIQNGVFTPRQTLIYAVLLFGVTLLGGLWLVVQTGPGLFWIGLAGLLIGWAYSAPPLKLNSRGLGELCVTAGFLLIVVGSDYVLRGEWALRPWITGLPYALLVTNVLYINQFPDRAADLAAGKRHWVARLSPAVAVWGYVLLLALGMLVLLAGLFSDEIWIDALLGLMAYGPAVQAAIWLRKNVAHPESLGPAIQHTILAAHLYPVMVAVLTWGNVE